MTEYPSARETLVSLLNRQLSVECILNHRTGAWVALTGYLKGLSGVTGNSGCAILKSFDFNQEGDVIVLPLRGILSIYSDSRKLIWKKTEEPTPEECCCTEDEHILSRWPFM